VHGNTLVGVAKIISSGVHVLIRSGVHVLIRSGVHVCVVHPLLWRFSVGRFWIFLLVIVLMVVYFVKTSQC